MRLLHGRRQKKGTTVAEKDLEQSEKIGFDRILECVVILSWNELMGPSTSGLVQIEYGTDAAFSLEYLKVWCSTIRGYANLVCEYWVQPVWSHVVGLQWVAGYNSAGFATLLESAIEHQDTYSKLTHRAGSIQICPPTEEEIAAAMNSSANTGLASSAIEPLVAA